MRKLAGQIGMIAFGMTLLPAMAAPVFAQDTTVATAHKTQHGPESVSDLAESLMDAVVNIAITQNTKAEGDDGVPVEGSSATPPTVTTVAPPPGAT